MTDLGTDSVYRSVERSVTPVLRTNVQNELTQNLQPTRDILTFRNARTRIQRFEELAR